VADVSVVIEISTAAVGLEQSNKLCRCFLPSSLIRPWVESQFPGSPILLLLLVLLPYCSWKVPKDLFVSCSKACKVGGLLCASRLVLLSPASGQPVVCLAVINNTQLEQQARPFRHDRGVFKSWCCILAAAQHKQLAAARLQPVTAHIGSLHT
jgi:hypothetical protein